MIEQHAHGTHQQASGRTYLDAPFAKLDQSVTIQLLQLRPYGREVAAEVDGEALFDIAEVQLVETVFTAGQGQDQAVVRYAGSEIGKVVTFATCAVAAADKKDMIRVFICSEF